MSGNKRQSRSFPVHGDFLWRARRAGLAIGVAAFLSPTVHAQSTLGSDASTAETPSAQAPPADASTTKTTAQAQNSTRLGEVVVTGQRAALKKASDRKKDSDKISDSIVADDIGKLPDNSVSEALQRIPGVSISHFPAGGGDTDNYTAEGGGALVRGMNQVQSTLNGRETFSANGGRTLSWEDVTPELISGVDVYKSQSADLIEGGVGGTIDLRTHMPFDFQKPTFGLTAKYNYADLADKWKPEASFLGADQWDTSIGKIGALIDVAYSDLATGTNTIGVNPYFRQTGLDASNPSKTFYVPAGIRYRDGLFDRKRLGLYGALQWKPSSQFNAYATYFRSRYSSVELAHDAEVNNGTQEIPDPSATTIYNRSNALVYTSALVDKKYSDPLLGYAEGPNQYDPPPVSTDTQLSWGATVTTDYSAGFKWKLADRLTLRNDLQLVRSGADSRSMNVFTWTNVPAVSFDTRGDLPRAVLTGPGYDSADLVQANCSYGGPKGIGCGYHWMATMDHIERHRGQEGAWRSDLDFDVSDDGLLRSLVGGLRLARRSETDAVSTYSWQQLSPIWLAYNGAASDPASSTDPNVRCAAGHTCHPYYFTYLSDAPSKDVQLDSFHNFFRGKVNLPGQLWFPSDSLVKDYPANVAALHQQFGVQTESGQGSDTTQPVVYRPYDLSYIVEKTYSGYFMARFAEDKLFGVPMDGNIGVRVVHVTDDIAGNITLPTDKVFLTPPSPSCLNPNPPPACAPTQSFPGGYHSRDASTSRTDVLPSLNMVFHLTPSTQARFALSRALNRPSFSNLTPAANIGTQTDVEHTLTAFIGTANGNPRLNPETANQVDLSLEWYGKGGSEAHVAVFYKDLRNYFGTRSVEETVDITYPPCAAGESGDGCGTTQPSKVLMTEKFNEGKARIRGLELGAQKFATFLPAPFDGLGINSNFTLLYSQQPNAVATDMDGQPIHGLPLEGLSKYTFNLIGMYEKGPWSARLAYNWRSRYLLNVGNNGLNGTYTDNKVQYIYSLPLFNRAYGQLDAYLGYTFLSNHVTVSAEAQNLTDAITRTEMGVGDQQHGRNWFMADRRYAVSMRLNF